MPVPNREWLRLTPVGATQPAPDYLKAQPPACSSWKASLAVFALFSFIVTVTLYSVCKRSRSSRRPDLVRPLVSYNLGKVDSGKVEPGSGPVVDAKNQEGSDKEPRKEMGAIKSDQVRFADDLTSRKSPKLAIDPEWSKDTDGSHFGFMTRPPPAPPLTPPELSTAVFTFEHRQHTQDSFMHQPNPDYMSSTESPASQASPSSPAGARRRSYNKTLPLGIPARQGSSTSETGSGDLGFISSSYPPTTSLLPPPPPGLQQTDDEARAPGTIDVTGEIISVLDREGAGWTRHTRVYGGGVCLACAASGGNHGGFYGENVSPEEMQ